jgi:hypothetical protein
MAMPPPVQYALSGDVYVAYQVVGNGPTGVSFSNRTIRVDRSIGLP